MKVRELFEKQKILTPSELEALPDPSPSNIEQAYKVGKVAFDNVYGMGQVPDNQNVIYKGFSVFMKPGDYMDLTPAADREKDASAIADKIKQGEPIGNPWLDLRANIDDVAEGKPLVAKIVGHEGRARTVAFEKINGSSEMMPVHVFVSDGYRSRHLSPEFFDELRKVGIIPQGGKDAKRVKLGKIFWNGKVY